MKYKRMTEPVLSYGVDIIRSNNIDIQKKCIQHGTTSVFEHSLGVACLSLYLSHKLPIYFDERSLVRGALLHDYFLYDWHVRNQGHNLHGFHHAKVALTNASKEFDLNDIEKDIIEKHMFPLNVKPPKYREGILVCIADKLCTIWEVLKHISCYYKI